MKRRLILAGVLGLLVPGLVGVQGKAPTIGRATNFNLGRAPTFGAPSRKFRNVELDVERLSVVPVNRPKPGFFDELLNRLPTIHKRKQTLTPAEVGLTPVVTKKER
jgi:hypothetical protein